MKLFYRLSLSAAALMSMAFNGFAAIPSGYYDKCEGKTGQALLTALYQTVSSHTTVSYDGLLDLYKTSDIDENGKIWDMYSTKRWNTGEKCGSYSKVGDCYNREHSMPKSWFNNTSPMNSDAFHVYPTDGKVNGQRGNYPFGECSGGTTLASNGDVKALGKLGTSTFEGYSGKVFEPDDMYKGDFARSYFYMAACYNDRIANWSSDMMAGNSYPAYKTWAVNLLLKWSRQDEVSQKELDRQEAVYARQKNRNPFIDHPELVEYIWGDKVGQAWYSTAAAETSDIVSPQQNVDINVGYVAVGQPRSVKVPVKTKGVKGQVYISIYGTGLSVSPYSLTADQANAGTEVTVTVSASSAGNIAGSFSVSADDMEREVNVTGTAVSGLPIYDATAVTSDEFTVRWTYVGTSSTYSLDVKRQDSNTSIAGYPRNVTASAETYTVTGLEPLTAYTFKLTDGTLTSATKSVTTADLEPSAQLIYNGSLNLTAITGTPSEAEEVLVIFENISEDVTITVNAPFELSTDKAAWTRSIVLLPEEEQFFIRVNSSTAGKYSSDITISAGAYVNDDEEVTATVSAPVDPTETIVEDFEVSNLSTTVKCYSNTTFQGNAFSWTVTNGGFGDLSQDKAFNGTTVMRFGKDATSTLAMNEDKPGGIGTVTFEAAPWSGDGEPVVAVEYSTDCGSTWNLADNITVDASTGTFSVPVDVNDYARIRFRQVSGKRWFLDNIAISGYGSLGAIERPDYQSWSAYAHAGELIVELPEKAMTVAVYSTDAMTWVNETLTPGTHSFRLPVGLYIVVIDDYARRVMVK
ncbi:MAG: endonuclease [Paramuribaculum sp.]|nr:endonuclease [Paramuribaculum sp.]